MLTAIPVPASAEPPADRAKVLPVTGPVSQKARGGDVVVGGRAYVACSHIDPVLIRSCGVGDERIALCTAAVMP
jgi:hypothetical protein